MSAVFLPRALRRRPPREDGFVAILAMAIMMLLFCSSLVLFTAAKVHIATAREGRDFTESRQGLGEAFADALYQFNAADTWAASGHSDRINGRGTWSWDYDAARREVTARGVVNGTEEEITRAVRGRYVGSYATASTGAVIYGIAANGPANGGAWASLLSASSDSTVNGTMSAPIGSGQPDIALYGSGKFTSDSTARATRYSDAADAAPGSTHLSTQRSALTAQLDQNLLAARVAATTECPLLTTSTPDPDGTGPLTATTGTWEQGAMCLHTSGSTTLPPVTTWSGVRTVIVNGNLTISDDISLGSGQLHLYVTGNVTFTKAAPSTSLTLGNVFVFAPNGLCATSTDTLAVALSGAMACDSFRLPSTANTLAYRAPSADANYPGKATQVIYYAESPGYVDSLTP